MRCDSYSIEGENMTNQELIDNGCGCETKITPTSLQCGGSRTTKDHLAKPRLSTIDNSQPEASSSRPIPAQVQRLNSLTGMRPKKTAWLVEVRPDEELPADFCVSLRRILVPTALDKASAVALDYTFHRLNVLSIQVLPLRDRPEDLAPLVDHFLQKHRSLTPIGAL